MIRLHPIPEVNHSCPYCKIQLETKDWYIPGMRNLADMICPDCHRGFYGDMPAGHGLLYPMLIEKDTALVHDIYGVSWFADWLKQSYAKRSNEPLEIVVEEFKPAKKAILLNCLDTLYGHSLLKLLNVQYYLDHTPDFGVIVLIPRFLRWLVPDGVSAIWTVDLPLNRGIEWNDWLANEIQERIEKLDECYLSLAFSHPHPKDFEIERFSRITPFPLDQWAERFSQRPTVTFIWRDDRTWKRSRSYIAERIRSVLRLLSGNSMDMFSDVSDQKRQVILLAEQLRNKFPSLDFAVVGMGKSGDFPDWVTDLRFSKIDEAVERSWCERYSISHVVIGVHGSNMLLPSAHSGSVVELLPIDRWGNMIQDLLLKVTDSREAVFLYRILSIETSAKNVAKCVTSLLQDYPSMLVHMDSAWCDHAKKIQNYEWSNQMKTCIFHD